MTCRAENKKRRTETNNVTRAVEGMKQSIESLTNRLTINRNEETDTISAIVNEITKKANGTKKRIEGTKPLLVQFVINELS